MVGASTGLFVLLIEVNFEHYKRPKIAVLLRHRKSLSRKDSNQCDEKGHICLGTSYL